MNRYLLFSGDYYYPSGGWEDFDNSYSSLPHAIEIAEGCIEKGADWSHIADYETGKVVWFFDGSVEYYYSRGEIEFRQIDKPWKVFS